MEEIYYAKSSLSDGRQPTCKEHISKVAELAEEYGDVFEQGKAAKLGATLHDFGKYSKRFSGVLRGTYSGVDHAIGGAAALRGLAGTTADVYIPIIEAINGHHDGLLDYGLLEGFLYQSVREDIPVHCNGGKEASLAGKSEYSEALAAFKTDFPDLRLTKDIRHSIFRAPDSLTDMLYTRMLFSCMVDADYSASAEDEHQGYLKASEGEKLCPDELLPRLLAYRERLSLRSTAAPQLNRLRDELFFKCGEAGKLPEGVFTLTAPTGLGKTLALLHFALRHCLEHGKSRIIVVLPFLTLADQNTLTYSEIIDDILVDHSQSELDDEARELASRWSAPFIITTSVKFFEALFARKPTDCRKLHNIANSVIVFDEAQSMPPELTSATLKAVNSLCAQYRCTMLYSTATQPCFDALPTIDWKPTEIIPEHKALYDATRRTAVQWRLECRTPFETIASEMSAERSVCAIVNRRDHARKLFRLLKEQCPEDEAFFLTTDLCAVHRQKIIRTIKARLSERLPCRVVATQCIEAGVDLDFAVMYRALAPLDAIIQAAGRCNRNGSGNPGDGRVIVFEPDEEKLYPSKWYSNAAELVKLLLVRKPIDIHNPDDIARYYTSLFQNAKDAKALTCAINAKDYEKVAAEYRLIKSQGVQVLVPVPGGEVLYLELLEEAKQNGITAKWLRRAAPITVSTFDEKAAALHTERLSFAARRSGECIPSNYYVLLPKREDCYTEDMGLQFRDVKSEDYMI